MRVTRFGLSVSVSVVGLFAIAALSGAAGCTFDDVTNGADTGYLPDDTGGDDVATDAPATLTPTVQQGASDVPGDFTCLGKQDAGAPDATPSDAGYDGGTPAPGQLVPTPFYLLSFNEGTRQLPDATIEVFYGNTFRGKTADVVGVTTDATGVGTAPMPAGWQIGYRVLAKDVASAHDSYVPYYELDQLVPTTPGTKMELIGMTKGIFQILARSIANASNYTIPAGTGIVAVRAVDCQRRFVRNLSMEVLDVTDATPKPIAFQKDCLTGPCLLYMSDAEFPDTKLTATGRKGLLAMVNVPSNRKLQIVAHGNDGTNPNATFGQRDLEVIDQAVTTLFVQP